MQNTLGSIATVGKSRIASLHRVASDRIRRGRRSLADNKVTRTDQFIAVGVTCHVSRLFIIVDLGTELGVHICYHLSPCRDAQLYIREDFILPEHQRDEVEMRFQQSTFLVLRLLAAKISRETNSGAGLSWPGVPSSAPKWSFSHYQTHQTMPKIEEDPRHNAGAKEYGFFFTLTILFICCYMTPFQAYC